jgi:hypothetical protein
MTEGIPEFLTQGEVARLIPVGATSQKERAACSVLLAALRVVHPFARDLLREMGKRFGSWASVEAYTEVVFQNQPDGTCRPDGLIVFDSGRRQWKALVEAKVGQGRISPDQLARYYRLARANSIDAIITISNELNPRPHHVPYDVPAEMIGNLDLYHWSWPHLVMVAEMLLAEEEDFDEEQHFILEEVVRYLDGETSEGGFQQMASGWPHLIQRIFSSGELSGNDTEVVTAIKSWHQAQSSICVWLGRELQRHVSLHLNRGHRESQSMRLLEDAEEFVTTRQLRATFHSPALARPFDLVADALRRNVTCKCSIEAPEDRRRYQSRISWLLEQLPENVGDTMVHIAWDNGQRTSVAVKRLRRDENDGRVDGALPVVFEISRSFDLAQRFGGPRLFVESVDAAVWTFYDSIARHLRAWQPRPSRQETGEEGTTQEADQIPERVVVREASVPGGKAKVFDDGSIEIRTATGTKWYRSFTELERSLRVNDVQECSRSGPSSEKGNGEQSSNVSSPSTESSLGTGQLGDPPVFEDAR